MDLFQPNWIDRSTSSVWLVPIQCVRVLRGSNLIGNSANTTQNGSNTLPDIFLNVVGALGLWNCSKPSYSALLMFFWTKITEILSSNLWPKSQKSFPAPVVLNHASYGYLDKIETEFIFFWNISTPSHMFWGRFSFCSTIRWGRLIVVHYPIGL